MPIYEYRCGACGHHLEALQKMTDSPLRKCPECGKSQLKWLVSASQFRLKGSGWYETDFKNDKEKKRNLVETASAESSDAPSDAPSDKSAAEPAKADAGKTAAAGGEGDKAKTPKPTSVKPAAKKPVPRRRPAPKPRAKVARG